MFSLLCPPVSVKVLIIQLFPRLAKAALTLESSTIIVVWPLISIMRDFGPQLLALVKRERRTRRKREGKCEIVFGSPESLLITKWQ